MRNLAFLTSFILATITALLRGADAPPDADTAANTLTDAEQSAGWKLLFDGKTTEGWHRYSDKNHPTTAPSGWTVTDGVLARTKSGSGDLCTNEQYQSFELLFQW